MHKIRQIAGLLACIMLVSSCSDEKTSDFDEPLVEPITYPIPKTLDEVRNKVSASAWKFEMTIEQYPSTFEMLGSQRFDEANELLKWAAAVGAESSKCNKVGTSDVSDKSNRQNLLFFVDCENWERIWVSEEMALEAKLKWENK